MVGEFVTERSGVELGVGESPKVMVENGRVKVVGQECLPTLLALDRMEPVVGQKRVVVDCIVSDFQLEGCRGYCTC